MDTQDVTAVFCVLLAASTALRGWLGLRQMRHVAAHRDKVPAPFQATVPLEAHRKAADYTLARQRFGRYRGHQPVQIVERARLVAKRP